MMRKFIALAAALMLAAPAHAEASASELLAEARKGNMVTLQYLNGVANGFSWANTVLSSDGRGKLFCPPEKLAITPEQDLAILEAFIKGTPRAGAYPAGMVLLLAYQETFPCAH